MIFLTLDHHIRFKSCHWGGTFVPKVHILIPNGTVEPVVVYSLAMIVYYCFIQL